MHIEEGTAAELASLAELRAAIAEAQRIEAGRPRTLASDARKAQKAVRVAFERFWAATDAAAGVAGP